MSSLVPFFIACGFAVISSIALASLLARALPALIASIHWLGFVLILAAGGQSVALLAFSAPGSTNQTLGRMVLLLLTGLALYLESARQHNSRQKTSTSQN